MVDSTVVTRFAPSPTGHLHIGGARTALLNWAYARQHGGQFILRMEDTDRARSTAASTRGILADLAWLGLDWDQGPDPAAEDPYAAQKGERGPYFQSQRAQRYRAELDRLFALGRAYKCFKTADDLTAEREAAKAAGRAYLYDPTEALGRSPEAVAQLEAQGMPFVVRFRMPGQDVVVQDLVLGPVTVRAAELEDFVIFKSDGGPTFHFANVVDDAQMGVTHVIRGQEHLNNTPRHAALADALGYDRPKYAHIPLIFNPDNTKMSKRDKAKAARAAAKAWMDNCDPQNVAQLFESAGIEMQAFNAFMARETDDTAVAAKLAQQLGVELPEIDVEDFRQSGYLPEVLCNYLALLGWSPGDDVERFGPDPLGFIRDRFTLERVGKSNARFDRDKLARFNTEAIAQLAPEAFAQRLAAHFRAYHREFAPLLEDPERWAVFAEAYRERSRTLSEPADNGRMFITPPEAIVYDDKAVKKNLLKGDGQGVAVLEQLRVVLTGIEPWSGEAAHRALVALAQEKALKLGQVAQPLRVAVSGGAVSPPIDATLELLGKAGTLARIDRCVSLFQPQA